MNVEPEITAFDAAKAIFDLVAAHLPYSEKIELILALRDAACFF